MKHRRCSICKSNEFFFFPSATFVNKETVCQLKISKSCEISKNNSRTSFGGVSQDIANKNWELRSITFHPNSYQKDGNAIPNYSITFFKILEDVRNSWRMAPFSNSNKTWYKKLNIHNHMDHILHFNSISGTILDIITAK